VKIKHERLLELKESRVGQEREEEETTNVVERRHLDAVEECFDTAREKVRGKR